MLQYPNYSSNIIQPNISYPNYGYQPLHMDRINQLQQFQQSLQQNNQMVPLGKFVENIDVVKTIDIPMDGNMYYFPKADGTEIYAKQWMANGQTRILSFKPILNEGVEENTQSEEKLKIDGIEEFTEVLENKLNEFYKKITDTKKKKEVIADE